MKSRAVVSGFFVLIMLALTVWVTPALATSSVQASRTAAQASLPIYRLKPPTVTTERLLDLASIFGLKGQPIELDDRLALRDGSRTVELYKASGAIWYADESQLFDPSVNPKLPKPDDALRDATTKFLIDHNLIPSDPSLGVTFDTFTGTILKTMDAATHKESTRQLDVQAMYNFSLNGLPVGCGGGKLKVTYGDQGQIINFFRVWREIDSQVDVFQVFDQSAADETFRQSLHGFQTKSISSTLEYCSAPAPDTQDFLAPEYVYSWHFESGGEMYPGKILTMPATSFEPLVRITSPASGTNLSATHLLATSSVSGGTPPYTFRWESSVDGLLGTGMNLNASLSSGWINDTSLSHAIMLTVTDSNGLNATDGISVLVGPVPGGTVDEVSFGSLAGTISIALGFVALGLLMRRRRRPAVGAMFIVLSFFLAAGVPSQAHAQLVQDCTTHHCRVGAWWIGPSEGLPQSSINAGGFVRSMTWANWEEGYNYGDWDFKEAHFREHWYGMRIYTEVRVEDMDFVFVDSHGGWSGFLAHPAYDTAVRYDEAEHMDHSGTDRHVRRCHGAGRVIHCRVSRFLLRMLPPVRPSLLAKR